MDIEVTGKLTIISFATNKIKYIHELTLLDKICLGDYGQAWLEDNFLLNMPQKDQLSKLAIINNKLVGYLICSSYQNQKVCHGHRIAVQPEYQRLGIAFKLWKEVFRECLTLGIETITVETPNNAITVNNLYGKFGFHPLKGTELKNYLTQKGKAEQIARFNEYAEGFGAYSMELKELAKNDCSYPSA